jgi:predicted dehydrogenase
MSLGIGNGEGPLAVGVVGCGYWGPNYVRNFTENERSTVIAVADQRPDRLHAIKRRYPGLLATERMDEILANPAVEAVAIATPVSTHFDLARAAIEAGKHVLVAKPLAATSAEAEALLLAAEQSDVVLMVDHTYVYTGAVRRIKSLLEEDALGELYYFDSVRVNLGLFQQDVNVVWDLAAHDLAIVTHLFDVEPVSIHAVGASHSSSGFEDVAYVTLTYPNNLIAHCHVNWLSPVKIRQALVAGSRRMLVWNDLADDELVKVYDHGVTVTPDREGLYELLVDYRMGDVWIPHLERHEALALEVEHFVDCVRLGETPNTGGPAGVGVVRLLEAASASMRDGGRPVVLEALTAS